MEDLEKRIESQRAELEALYMKAKAGILEMEKAIDASAELDRLILEKNAGFIGKSESAAGR